MNRIIKALAGQSTAKKYAAYAAFVTAILLAIALVVLAVTSIAFAIGDGDDEVIETGGGDGGDVLNEKPSSLPYTVVSEFDEAVMGGELVNAQDNRSELSEGGLYYGAYKAVALKADAQQAIDALLVNFYGVNSKTLVTDIDADGCNLPLLKDASSDGLSVDVLVYHDDSTTYNVAAYKWIYDNAYKYGFIYNEDTFTYVGSAAATYMKNKSVTSYDTFISTLKANGDKNVAVSAYSVETGKTVTYQMYYIAADGELKAPTNYEYFVLGNATDGYVVTVNMSKKTAAASTDTTAE